MAKKEKLPSSLYVKLEEDGDIEYFVAGTEFSALVEMGETAKIGVYTRSEVVEVEGKAVKIIR